MTIKAFVLIQTEIEVARTSDVLTALKQLGNRIKTADQVTGPYDIIIEVGEETPEQLATLVLDEIHFIPGVHNPSFARYFVLI